MCPLKFIDPSPTESGQAFDRRCAETVVIFLMTCLARACCLGSTKGNPSSSTVVRSI